jgi:hypothetical protein
MIQHGANVGQEVAKLVIQANLVDPHDTPSRNLLVDLRGAGPAALGPAAAGFAATAVTAAMLPSRKLQLVTFILSIE